MEYAAYILECADGTLYSGWTTDLARRVKEHNSAKVGAKYTRSRRPVVLKYSELFSSKVEAQQREYALKQLDRSQKLLLIQSAVVQKRPKKA